MMLPGGLTAGLCVSNALQSELRSGGTANFDFVGRLVMGLQGQQSGPGSQLDTTVVLKSAPSFNSTQMVFPTTAATRAAPEGGAPREIQSSADGEPKRAHAFSKSIEATSRKGSTKRPGILF